jgi:hypothetical protein
VKTSSRDRATRSQLLEIGCKHGAASAHIMASVNLRWETSTAVAFLLRGADARLVASTCDADHDDSLRASMRALKRGTLLKHSINHLGLRLLNQADAKRWCRIDGVLLASISLDRCTFIIGCCGRWLM